MAFNMPIAGLQLVFLCIWPSIVSFYGLQIPLAILLSKTQVFNTILDLPAEQLEIVTLLWQIYDHRQSYCFVN